MWFKNLQIYRLPAPWDMSAERLEEQLAKKPFHPCGSQDMESRGWLSPLGNEVLVHAVGGQFLICLGFEHRLLPSAVVKQEADERAEELAEQQGYKLGRKQMKELREQVTQELLPRAFTRRRRMFAWLDPVNGWLVVDAGSQSKAEDMLEQLRHTLDSLPLTLLRTELSPTSAMAAWLAKRSRSWASCWVKNISLCAPPTALNTPSNWPCQLIGTPMTQPHSYPSNTLARPSQWA